MSIEYGSQVAVLEHGIIRFGYVAAIVHRTNSEGEKTEYVISSIGNDGTANSDFVVRDASNIADMGSWNKDDALLGLARRSEAWKWAEKRAEEIANPPPVVVNEPAPPTPALTAEQLKQGPF